MRLIPVPDSAMEKYPEGVKHVISPPDGDLMNEECRPADMLLRPTTFMEGETIEYMAFFQMEPEDVDALKLNGGVLELSMISHVVPFNVTPL